MPVFHPMILLLMKNLEIVQHKIAVQKIAKSDEMTPPRMPHKWEPIMKPSTKLRINSQRTQGKEKSSDPVLTSDVLTDSLR